MRADPERTLAAVRAMGYDDVELLWSFDNFGRTPQQVRATLDHEGLEAPSAHMAPEVILKDWDKSLETAHLLGHQYLVVPSLPDETKHSLDAWRQWADRFNAAGAVGAARRNLARVSQRARSHEADRRRRAVRRVHRASRSSRACGSSSTSATCSWWRRRSDALSRGASRSLLELSSQGRRGRRHARRGARRGHVRLSRVSSPRFRTSRHKPCYVEQESPSDELASARQTATTCAGSRSSSSNELVLQGDVSTGPSALTGVHGHKLVKRTQTELTTTNAKDSLNDLGTLQASVSP